jgi:predicted nucleotidyltransferase component of viral defense system
MDKHYADTVRLLLAVAPDVFAGDIFALKGGTAINLFVRDMPRLSVDLDLVYVPLAPARTEALKAITNELAAIASRLTSRGLNVRAVNSDALDDIKFVIESKTSQVKVEVNPVFRGTVLNVERRMLVAQTAKQFSVEIELPVLAPDELYGGKLVAALDRQHPRDLFDVWQLYEHGGISDGTIECFVTYLAGHHRPTHEVLFAKPKDVAREYQATFVGMTTEPVSLDTLLNARARLFKEVPVRLTEAHRRFLIGFVRTEPDWTLLKCPHAAQLPALRWKLINLEKFKTAQPKKFEAQANALEGLLAS